MQQITDTAEKKVVLDKFGIKKVKGLFSTSWVIVQYSGTLQKWHAMDVIS